jgi:MFS family permease
MTTRQIQLKRNFSLLFWVQAFTSIQVMSAISTIFIIARGLTLSQIYLLSIVFSVTSLVAEIPSSYLADRWSRKWVIVISCISYLLYWVSFYFAHSLFVFVLGTFLYAISNALLSGTDEALLYDTSRELNADNHSLQQLGVYFSAQRMFKIVFPIIAVLIAHNLSNSQFKTIISIDIIAAIGSIVVAYFLTEPKHIFSIEKVETGIMKDALKLFHQNPPLLITMINKNAFFIATFILWRMYSDFFYTRGVPLLGIGLITSAYQFINFFGSWFIHKWFPSQALSWRLNSLGYLATLAIVLFFINSITLQNIWVFMISFIIIASADTVRAPLFSQYFNQASNSYNRATVISISNVLKSILDIPLLLVSAYLVSQNYTTLFALTAIIAMSLSLFARIPNRNQPSRESSSAMKVYLFSR